MLIHLRSIELGGLTQKVPNEEIAAEYARRSESVVEDELQAGNQSELAAEKGRDTTPLPCSAHSYSSSGGGGGVRFQVEFDDVVDGFAQQTLDFRFRCFPSRSTFQVEIQIARQVG